MYHQCALALEFLSDTPVFLQPFLFISEKIISNYVVILL